LVLGEGHFLSRHKHMGMTFLGLSLTMKELRRHG